ncbi:MAG: ABC transporter substrate-binding protein [Thiohalocapsa sp.]
MKASRTIALGVAAIGLALLIAGPLLPGGERLSRLDLPSPGHVTDLAPGGDGSILAGTQDGEIWRLVTGQWGPVAIDLGGHPVTALTAEPVGYPTRGPIGTAAGLVNAPPGMPPLSMRISDEILTSNGLVVATGTGLQIQAAGAWQPALHQVNVYRLDRQSVDGSEYIHAGTVGEGAYSARADALRDWRPNRDGLPEGAYVFTFAVTEGGRLLAGTDQGLYWQDAPFQPWALLKTGLENSRILSAHIANEPLSEASNQDSRRLWVGSDKGLYRVDLSEDDDGIEALAYASLIEAPPDHVQFGISWILPYDDGILFSAGSIYRYGPAGFPGWYWISLGGVLLILLGGWLFPGRDAAEPSNVGA